MDLFQKCHFETLDLARALDVYPYFHVLESRQAPVVQMEGKRMIMLGSNNYLGFTEDEQVIKAGHAALDKYGTGVSGSRFLNGTLDLHLQLEKELAAFTGKQTWQLYRLSVAVTIIYLMTARTTPASMMLAN